MAETTAPVQVPAWATDDVVDFMIKTKEAEDLNGWIQNPAQPQQVDLNPQSVVEPVIDQKVVDQAAAEEKLRIEIENQKAFDAEADNLMKELEKDQGQELTKNKEDTKPKEDIEVIPDDKKTDIQKAIGKISQLSVEEQEEFIIYVDELQKSMTEMSAEKIKSDQELADLRYENSLLKDSSKKYIEKSTSLEQDEIRNKIPEEISELVTSFKDFNSKKDDFTRKQYRKNLIRETEKEFKRSLNDYIGDAYIWSNDTISWQESSDMTLPKWSPVSQKQESDKKLDYMKDLF